MVWCSFLAKDFGGVVRIFDLHVIDLRMNAIMHFACDSFDFSKLPKSLVSVTFARYYVITASRVALWVPLSEAR